MEMKTAPRLAKPLNEDRTFLLAVNARKSLLDRLGEPLPHSYRRRESPSALRMMNRRPRWLRAPQSTRTRLRTTTLRHHRHHRRNSRHLRRRQGRYHSSPYRRCPPGRGRRCHRYPLHTHSYSRHIRPGHRLRRRVAFLRSHRPRYRFFEWGANRYHLFSLRPAHRVRNSRHQQPRHHRPLRQCDFVVRRRLDGHQMLRLHQIQNRVTGVTAAIVTAEAGAIVRPIGV